MVQFKLTSGNITNHVFDWCTKGDTIGSDWSKEGEEGSFPKEYGEAEESWL